MKRVSCSLTIVVLAFFCCCSVADAKRIAVIVDAPIVIVANESFQNELMKKLKEKMPTVEWMAFQETQIAARVYKEEKKLRSVLLRDEHGGCRVIESAFAKYDIKKLTKQLTTDGVLYLSMLSSFDGSKLIWKIRVLDLASEIYCVEEEVAKKKQVLVIGITKFERVYLDALLEGLDQVFSDPKKIL